MAGPPLSPRDARRSAGGHGSHAAAGALGRSFAHDDGPVRQAGREEMRDPPRRWDLQDETVDESFPASDPPSSY
ncbi:hypothetical protein [Limimaricola cinnabarinus]|uniref:hypothetical protein n=1 Tax=Limimaricola cinnabarinus TaxID=1125964 RepID=UPI003F7103B0